MNSIENAYHRFYDDLFGIKDYEGEVARLRARVKARGLEPRCEVLDVGCGTGNHSIWLARLIGPTTGVDIDPAMIERARRKVPKELSPPVKFRHGDASAAPRNDYALACSLFYVVNHLMSLADLRRFFGLVASRLRPGGLLFFDCWNGLAALRDLPSGKTYPVIEKQGVRMECILRSETDLLLQRTLLRLDFHSTDLATGAESRESVEIPHLIWTPLEIEDALGQAGFVVLERHRAGSFAEATATDWKLEYLCQRQ